MISFEQALEIVLNKAPKPSAETVGFMKAPGRVLAAPVYSDVNMPPFDKSAMDGYACRREDLGTPLKIIESIPAGVEPLKKIQCGECAQIMTGAKIPAGADTVIKVEETENIADGRIRFTGENTRPNICSKGEDLTPGALVLDQNSLLSYRHIPILASVGAVRVKVYTQPQVGVMATGTELVEPDQAPGDAQIRNSNGWQTISQLNSFGINPDYFGIALDDEDFTLKKVEEIMINHDLLILSGGVSMGEFDFVVSVLKKLGYDIHFQKISIQPGKPTTFASKGDKFIFGLPGNPVSSYFSFELFVKPFIYKYMGGTYIPTTLPAFAGNGFSRKRASRMGWVPVKISENNIALPLEYHGSAHIHALRDATGIVAFPLGSFEIKEGEIINVRLI